MGITSIFEVSAPTSKGGGGGDGSDGGGGRVCTVSPYGVRIHTRGGMVVSSSASWLSSRSSSSSSLLSGMTCGAPMPGGDGRHAVVGGMSPPILFGSSSQNVHCVDLHRDMRIVSSHSLLRGGGGGGPASSYSSTSMCIADMTTNVERNSVVVGCTDGTIRLLDSGRSNVEIAKARAHVGGVARVAASEVRDGGCSVRFVFVIILRWWDENVEKKRNDAL